MNAGCLILALPALMMAAPVPPARACRQTAGSAPEVRGVVHDMAGAPLAGAEVRLLGGHKEVLASALTKADGSFHLPVAAVGHDCTLEVSLPGFTTLVRSHLEARDLPQGSTFVLKGASPHLRISSLESAGAFSDDIQLKAGGIDDPSSGGGYSDSATATRSELIRDYAKGKRIEPVPGSIDLASASEAEISRYASALLLQQKFEAATPVFQQGVERYPQSEQLQLGLGTALYGQGRYQDAIAAWLAAAGIHPSSAQACLFLAKASMSAASLPAEQRREIVKRLEAFASARPQDALAHYYFGIVLLRSPDETSETYSAGSEFNKAVSLDPGLADAHFELGNLAAQQGHDREAILKYEQAIRLRPSFATAHYRLAQAYERTGEKSKAQAELSLWQRLRVQGADKRQ